jgi:hypothetical protein
MVNSKVARRVMFSGASSTNGIRSDTINGGGDKKGGSAPSGTGQMRSFAMRNTVSEPGKNKNFVLKFVQRLSPARHAGPKL